MNMRKILTVAVALVVITAFAAAPAIGADDAKAAPEKQNAFTFTGSDFFNMELRDKNGDNLGRVREILLGADGTLTYVLVASAGGTGGELIPIPFSPGMWKFERNAAIVQNLDKSELGKAPTVTLLELDKLNDPEFGSNIHGYYREAIRQ